MSVVTRFAPSPTGYLHRGHAFSALTAFAAAREAGGRFLLRLEDIDEGRCRPEYAEAIAQDLAWLGLAWEEPVRRQSRHMDDYRVALARLEGDGLLYRCFRTRRDVLAAIASAPHGADPSSDPYPGKQEPPDARQERSDYALRLNARAALERVAGLPLAVCEFGRPPRPLDPAAIGDVVLGRKDVGVAYHLAVVVDDALQGVTDVIRGEDLAASADVQRLLQALLGLPPVRYRHHRLLLRPDGKRFAKRDTAETLRDLRARGVTAERLRAELGFIRLLFYYSGDTIPNSNDHPVGATERTH